MHIWVGLLKQAGNFFIVFQIMIFISHHTSCLPRTPEVRSSKYRESKTNFTLRALHNPTHKTAQTYWQKTAGDSFVFIYLMCACFKPFVNDVLSY